MTRTVNCSVLKKEAEALERIPYPGELGIRIFENVSAEGWDKWIEMQTMLINENGVSTMNEEHLKMLKQHMLGFLFQEGDFVNADGYNPGLHR